MHTGTGNSCALGWITQSLPGRFDYTLTHAGSNNLWYALVRLMPDDASGFLIVTNAARSSDIDAIRDLEDILIERILNTP